jgi:cysteine desulfurase
MMEGSFVYMDYNATTPLDPAVARFMSEDMGNFANASSMHEAGRRARAGVESARERLAALAGCSADEIVFTSGGSESNNTVFQTAFELGRKDPSRKRIIISAIEHPCVMNAAARLAELGFEVVSVPVDRLGRVDPGAYAKALDRQTLLVSVMAANNEIGTVQDIPALAKAAAAAGAFFHTDAVQALGKIPVDLHGWGIDYASFSAHKIYGPKGVGALYVKRGSPLYPLIRGGHQENGLRSGTYNAPGIAAFGLAARIAGENLAKDSARLGALKDRLREGILSRIPKVKVNGHPEFSLPNTLNASFPGAEGEAILLSLDLEGIEVSTGSACASGSLEPSHVLMATGIGPELAHGSVRFSLGRGSAEADVDRVLSVLPPAIERLRKMTTIDWMSEDIGRSA